MPASKSLIQIFIGLSQYDDFYLAFDLNPCSRLNISLDFDRSKIPGIKVHSKRSLHAVLEKQSSLS